MQVADGKKKVEDWAKCDQKEVKKGKVIPLQARCGQKGG
jgi:hypothetical protein